jgi:hypothetical protein
MEAPTEKSEPTLIQRTPVRDVLEASGRVQDRWLAEGRGADLENSDDPKFDEEFWS